MICIDFTIL